MTLPLALNSEPWKILTLVMDSIDFPSMGLMTLDNPTHKTTVLNKTKTRSILVHNAEEKGNVLLLDLFYMFLCSFLYVGELKVMFYNDIFLLCSETDCRRQLNM